MKVEVDNVSACVSRKDEEDVCKYITALENEIEKFVKSTTESFDEITNDEDAIYQVTNIVDNIGLAIKEYGWDNEFHTSSKPVVTITCHAGKYEIHAKYDVIKMNDDNTEMVSDSVLNVTIFTNDWGNGVIDYENDKEVPTYMRDREKEQLLNKKEFCEIVMKEVEPI